MTLVPLHKRQGSDLARLHHEMDDLFNSFFGGWPTYEHRLWPAIDVADNEDAIVVKAEVPGCKADDINISVHGSTLTITGEKKQEEEKKEKGYYHMERSYGSFRRDLSLPNDVDTTKVDAACKDGVLTITLPKAEKAKTVKVKIKEQ
ncbi:MAG TPA: Hsp20/alpha crystallin family protein [Sedimentisphaerales bacterium]|nr:Hsp20/alpha crystallin family protein [Sedimentisphaerales bacterium]